MGSYARVSSNHVKNWRALRNASKATTCLDVELHYSTYHAGKKLTKFILIHSIDRLKLQVFREDPRVKHKIHEMELNVEQGCMTAGQAAEILLRHFVPDTIL